MCGILGAFRPTPGQKSRFAAALDLISHRGPDGSLVVAEENMLLGHRRLAIIDLDVRSIQPMRDARTGALICFNGEIYNYIELREQLRALGAVFVTESDTEVLLQAWLHWGEAMFARLNGMWAFALWDPREQQLLLARDRFGVKPLYYAQSDGSLIFASEPKSLFCLQPDLAEASPAALVALFDRSSAHAGAGTFFRSVSALPPAHFATIRLDAQELAVRPYWTYPETADARSPSPDDAAGQFSDLLNDAVKIRLRSDVPVGLTLSGGLDSSAILAAATGEGASGIRSFTSVYGRSGEDEESWARRAAGIAGSPLTTVPAEAADWLGTLERIVWHMDSPGYSPAVFPLWQIMATARAEGVPVLLEGQGADELLAGYPQYAAVAAVQSFKSLLRGQDSFAQLAGYCKTGMRTFTAKWFALWALRSAFPGIHQSWKRRTKSIIRRDIGGQFTGGDADFHSGSALLDSLHRDHARDVLPALLQYGDAVSMAHSIESRLPFMDYRLVEWVFRHRPLLISSDGTKLPVRRYLQKTGFGVIAARQDKKGYPTPIIRWMQGIGSPVIRDMLASPNAAIWDVLAPAAIEPLLRKCAAGDYISSFQLYKVLNTHMWLDQLARQRSAIRSTCISSPVSPFM
jgi:asparagine synthase (glutamine-hydrolysing)